MAIIWRHSALAQRHAEIDGDLEDWNGMGTAWFYDDTSERAQADYEAIRTKAGLMDVSGLKKVHLVGFHGITIDHNPSKKKTIQLGDPLLLKQMINLPIVFNFRLNDLKNGGQGAPLIPVYHRALAKKIKEKKPTLFINIGGISNFTYINKNKMFY